MASLSGIARFCSLGDDVRVLWRVQASCIKTMATDGPTVVYAEMLKTVYAPSCDKAYTQPLTQTARLISTTIGLRVAERGLGRWRKVADFDMERLGLWQRELWLAVSPVIQCNLPSPNSALRPSVHALQYLLTCLDWPTLWTCVLLYEWCGVGK